MELWSAALEADTETDRQTQRQTGRHKDRQADTKTDRQGRDRDALPARQCLARSQLCVK